MKKGRIVLVVLVLAGVVAAGMYGYMYKDARKISEEAPAFSLSAEKLLAQYSSNPQKSDSLFLNKTLEINGVITQVTDSVATIDSLVFCGFDHKPDKNSLSKKVTIKGRCIGYDELFNEVKLDQCTIKE
jgi:anionic cell wall polymer biosynthesis LytR-Cps2A-Psr (LCP) family protein